MAASTRIFPGLRVSSDRTRRKRVVLLVLFLLLAGVVFLSVDKGAVEISLAQCLAIIVRRVGVHLPWSFSAQQEATLINIRLPRVLLGVLVGAGLGTSGAVMSDCQAVKSS